MTITVTVDSRPSNTMPTGTRSALVALLPSDVAQRADYEHLEFTTAASALRVLAALPGTEWQGAVHEAWIDFQALLMLSWDSQSWLMLRIAASLYGSPYASADVRELAHLWPENLAAVVDAFRIFTEGFVPESSEAGYPQFIVQHTARDLYQVVAASPSFGQQPVEGGADLTADEAFSLRDRLNAGARRLTRQGQPA